MPVVPVNTGVIDPSDRLSSEIRQGTSDFLHLVDLDETPFLSILRALPSEGAKQTQVIWLQKQNRPAFSALAASANSANSGTTSTFAVATGTGAYFRVGDLAVLFHQDVQEAVTVVSISTDNVVVNRNVDPAFSVSAQSAQSGSQIMILGPAIAQGADIGTQVQVAAASAYNYTEIFRTPVKFTATAAEIARFGSRKKNRDIAFALAEHYRQLEATAFFGARSYTADAGNGFPLGTMGGLARFIPQVMINGTLSASGFAAVLDQPFAVGSKQKVVFAGPRAAQGLQAVYGVNFVPNLNDRKRWGVRPDWFLNTQYGLVPGFTHGDWHPSSVLSVSETEAPETVNASTGPAQGLFVVDAKHVKYRPLRDTNLEKDRQGPGVDGDYQEWVTECSLEVSNPNSHLYVGGITG